MEEGKGYAQMREQLNQLETVLGPEMETLYEQLHSMDMEHAQEQEKKGYDILLEYEGKRPSLQAELKITKRKLHGKHTVEFAKRAQEMLPYTEKDILGVEAKDALHERLLDKIKKRYTKENGDVNWDQVKKDGKSAGKEAILFYIGGRIFR